MSNIVGSADHSHKGQTDNKSVLVQEMDWCLTDDKPLAHTILITDQISHHWAAMS